MYTSLMLHSSLYPNFHYRFRNFTHVDIRNIANAAVVHLGILYLLIGFKGEDA
jgi:hypothetical protein